MNFQNIPRNDKVVKQAFRPKLDALLFFDYKQIEYRLLAFYVAMTLGDESMAEVFKRGDDLHTESARAILKLARDPTEEERDVGKTYNFLTIYGGGAKKASDSLNISLKDAKLQQAAFHKRWPSIKRLHNPPFRNGGYRDGEGPGAIQEAFFDKGYLTTLWGRHLKPVDEAGKRAPHKDLNWVIQGSAGDLLRLSLVKVHDELTDCQLKSHLVSNVHDEIFIDATFDEIPLLENRIPILMDHGFISEVVPIEVDMEWTTSSWAEKQSYKEVPVAG